MFDLFAWENSFYVNGTHCWGGGFFQRYLGCYVFVYFGNNIWYKEIVTGIYNSPVMLEMKNNSNKSMRNIRKKCVQVKSAYLYV